MSDRPWTRLGVFGVAGHLACELVSGVGAAGLSGGSHRGDDVFSVLSFVAHRAAGRLRSPRGDRRLAVEKGLFVSAVVAHLISWLGRPGGDAVVDRV